LRQILRSNVLADFKGDVRETRAAVDGGGVPGVNVGCRGVGAIVGVAVGVEGGVVAVEIVARIVGAVVVAVGVVVCCESECLGGVVNVAGDEEVAENEPGAYESAVEEFAR